MGFDKYMNLVLGDTEEVHIKNKTKEIFTHGFC